MLTLNLLGEVQVLLNQHPITRWPTEKVRALLIYLALERRPNPRSELAAFLWPGYSPESAANSLRVALHQLRQAIGDAAAAPAWLLISRQTIELNPAANVSVDVVTFNDLLAQCDRHPHPQIMQCADCTACLRQAATLYQGDFLAGFGVDDSSAFEEWRRLQQEQLHIQALALLRQLAETAEAAGDDSATQHYAQRQLALEPWSEMAHRQLMRSLAHTGRQNAALAQYQLCCQVLVSELNATPEAKTTALYEQIRSGQFDKVTGRQGDRETRRQGEGATSDKVNESLSHPVTQSLPHLVSPSPLHDWGEMPAAEHLQGRAMEMTQLAGWLGLQEGGERGQRCRLVAVLGMGGTGKTTLAAAMTKTVAPIFDTVIWRSLLNAPPLAEVLADWLQILARQTLFTLPGSFTEQLRLLLEYLRRQRCLLVLDNLESILQPEAAGALRPGYEGYSQLLQQVGGYEHQSVLLLTSREQPQALTRLLGQSTAVRTLLLAGLDVGAGHALLQAQGLTASTTEAHALVTHYSGNPLALQLVAQTIQELFGGETPAFLAEGVPIFEDIRTVLDQQYARLSPLEQELLLWLAIEREAVTLPALRLNLVQPPPISVVVEAVRALQRRSLLEKSGAGFTLQNVVMEYVTTQLVAGVCAELLNEDKATRRQGEITYFADHLPLSLFNRHALIKAQAKEYVRHSQVRLILQPLSERLRKCWGKEALAAESQQILALIRAQPALTPGYAAGNLLNLLLHWEVDLRNFDFSQLAIWQAHLRGATAPNLSLTGSELKGASFTDDFASIFTLTFSPDGQLLAAAGADHTICLWDTRTWQRLSMLQGHTHSIYSLRFHPTQSLLASSGADGTIRLWHLHEGNIHPGFVWQQEGYIHAIAFSPDGVLLASSGDDQLVSVRELATGNTRHLLRGHRGRVFPIAFSPDGRILASGGEDRLVHLWDVQTGELLTTLTDHTQAICALVFVPSAAGTGVEPLLLASASEDGLIILWNLSTLQPHAVLHGQGGATNLVFSYDGRLLATTANDSLIYLWDMQESAGCGQLRRTLATYQEMVYTMAFHSNSSMPGPQPLLLASGGEDQTIRLWDIADGRLVQRLQGYRNKTFCALFRPDGKVLATSHADGTVRLWTVQQDSIENSATRIQRTLLGHRGHVFALAFSADGALLASGSNDQTIRLWDSHSGELVRIFSGHADDIASVAFSPDGALLVSTSQDKTIRLWAIANGKLLRTWSEQKCRSWSAVFSPSGTTLASGDFDHLVRLWDVATGRLLQSYAGHNWEIEKVAFSPDGTLLASASHDCTVRLWAVASGETRHILQGHTHSLWAVAFSPDGTQLASCGEDQTVRLWDLCTHTSQVFTVHTEEVFSVAFDPSGQLLVSASADGTSCIWNTQSGRLQATLRVTGPYTGMKITGVTGISVAQKAALKALGAVEE